MATEVHQRRERSAPPVGSVGPDRVATGSVDAQRAASAADAELVAERRRAAAARLLAAGAVSPGPVEGDDGGAVDDVLLEVRSHALGGDIDDAGAGKRLVVLPDRLELRDGRGRVHGAVAVGEVASVAQRRRLSSSVLVVASTDGTVLKLKGVKGAMADALRDLVAELHLGSPVQALLAEIDGGAPTADVLRQVDALATKGLLTQAERIEMRAAVTRRARDRHR